MTAEDASGATSSAEPAVDPGAGVDGTEAAEPSAPEDRGRSLRQSARLTAIVGVAFSVLYIISALVMSLAPGGQATDDQLRAYYTSDAAELPLVVGLYLMPLAGVCFIWFIVVLRIWAVASGRRPAILQSNLQLVSGIAFVILTFVGAAAGTVVAAAAQVDGGRFDVSAARQFPIYGRAITLFFTMKMAAMYVITTSLIGRGPRAFPNWFAWAGFAVGLFLALSPIFSPILVLVFPLWVIVLCAIVFRAARRIPDGLFVDDVIDARRTTGIRSGAPLVPPPDG
jgi:hypothetical protein